MPSFKTILLSLWIITCSLLTTGCDYILQELKDNIKPLPEDKYAYAGYWEGKTERKNLTMWIKKDGDFYAVIDKPHGRNENNDEYGIAITKNLHGHIQSIDDSKITVLILAFPTSFTVNQPPYTENDHWYMQVDGVKLTKKPWAELPDAFKSNRSSTTNTSSITNIA